MRIAIIAVHCRCTVGATHELQCGVPCRARPRLRRSGAGGCLCLHLCQRRVRHCGARAAAAAQVALQILEHRADLPEVGPLLRLWRDAGHREEGEREGAVRRESAKVGPGEPAAGVVLLVGRAAVEHLPHHDACSRVRRGDVQSGVHALHNGWQGARQIHCAKAAPEATQDLQELWMLSAMHAIMQTCHRSWRRTKRMRVRRHGQAAVAVHLGGHVEGRAVVQVAHVRLRGGRLDREPKVADLGGERPRPCITSCGAYNMLAELTGWRRKL